MEGANDAAWIAARSVVTANIRPCSRAETVGMFRTSRGQLDRRVSASAPAAARSGARGGPRGQEPQDVSPDGKWLLFVDQRQAGAGDIKVLPLSPAGPARPFVATQFNELSPRFSPDGHWVAYQSDVSGRPEIYVRPFEGSVVTTRLSKDGGRLPRWSANGKGLFYLAPSGRFMVVPISVGVSTAAPRLFFQAADAVDFEPAADGSRFVVQLEERSSEPPVHLLMNCHRG